MEALVIIGAMLFGAYTAMAIIYAVKKLSGDEE